LVWVQDYHLMLLPSMLRERMGDDESNVKIGFFLHTPFPSSEIYRQVLFFININKIKKRIFLSNTYYYYYT
jgi:trehalose-6-phosphate synthase